MKEGSVTELFLSSSQCFLLLTHEIYLFLFPLSVVCLGASMRACYSENPKLYFKAQQSFLVILKKDVSENNYVRELEVIDSSLTAFDR